MADTFETPALGFMQIVSSRDTATLLPIIAAHVAPCTEVHSDPWSAYNRVGFLPGVADHLTVNHSLYFVDSVTSTHTQHIESYWNWVKDKLKSMRGCRAGQALSYLDEFMWRERLGYDSFICFYNILCHIAQQYPVPWSQVAELTMTCLKSLNNLTMIY